MVPREAGRGSSFKGAGLYYLHDKEAETTERVSFTQCENLPTQDPQKALGWMAWTAMIAPELKRSAGLKMTGRKRTGKPVYTASLAWHPAERKPTQAEMIAEGRAWLLKQGLQEHQVLMVAHSDRSHPHVHLIVNLVHPLTGRVNRLSFSKLKSSRYAQTFEEATGVIRCPERVENNRRRGRERPEKLAAKADIKAVVTAIYQAADSGRALQAGLKEAGLILAQGKRVVVIDQAGKVHNLTRLLAGVRSKALAAKLGRFGLPSIETVQRAMEGSRKKDRMAGGRQPMTPTVGTPSPARAEKVLQARHVQELLAFRLTRRQDRDRLVDTLDAAYGGQERQLKGAITTLERRTGRSRAIPKLWDKLTGKARANAEELAGKRESLANLEWRKNEAYGALDTKAMQQEKTLLAKQREERQKLDQGKNPDEERHTPADDRNARALALDRARLAKKHGLHRGH